MAIRLSHIAEHTIEKSLLDKRRVSRELQQFFYHVSNSKVIHHKDEYYLAYASLIGKLGNTFESLCLYGIGGTLRIIQVLDCAWVDGLHTMIFVFTTCRPPMVSEDLPNIYKTPAASAPAAHAHIHTDRPTRPESHSGQSSPISCVCYYIPEQDYGYLITLVMPCLLHSIFYLSK
jgi:hypothetical protein